MIARHSAQKPLPEFRSWIDPRRHVPVVRFIDNHPDHTFPVWQVSVIDMWGNLHNLTRDTWAEAIHLADQWHLVNVRDADGLARYTGLKEAA